MYCFQVGFFFFVSALCSIVCEFVLEMCIFSVEVCCGGYNTCIDVHVLHVAVHVHEYRYKTCRVHIFDVNP